MKKIDLLSDTEKKIWRIGSELQAGRPKTSPGPSLEEIAKLAGISKMTVSYAISVLRGRQIARCDGSSARRSLWFVQMYPEQKKRLA